MDEAIETGGEPYCKICARGGSHALRGGTWGKYSGAAIAVCPRINDAADETTNCADCGKNLVGTVAASVTTDELGDESAEWLMYCQYLTKLSH